MDYKIQIGINPEHKEEAARLYAIAFQTKFEKILGNPEIGTKLIKNGINSQRAISAISEENELLGIVGFHFARNSLIEIKFKDFVEEYGFLIGAYKLAIIALLFYRKPDRKDQLLMDGIVVKEGSRGKGIGKLLFLELEKFAKNGELSSIKLDVIDENPGAKKLYEKIGFVPSKHQKLPRVIYRLIGVSGVTTMTKKLY
ncbi:MAG: N-acetyltransferase family protein [Alkaliphilus sp.]